MDFKISDTNKGKKSLIYDGFIYRIDGVLKCGDISWLCTNKKCKGLLRTDSAMSTMNASDFIWPFLRPYMGVIPNPKLYFPYFMYFSIYFPNFHKIFSQT